MEVQKIKEKTSFERNKEMKKCKIGT